MSHFWQVLAKNFMEMPKHGSLFEKLQSFGKINDFSSCFTKRGTFWTFFLKVHRKAKTWELVSKVAKFWPNRWFRHFSRKAFLQLFAENLLVSSKSCKFRPNRWFSVIFHEMSHFFHLFAEKLTKTLKHGSFIEKLQALSKSMIFRAFWRNEPLFLQLFAFRDMQNRWFFVHFLEMSHFLQLFPEKLSRNMVVSSKSCKFWPNGWFFVLFREMSHFLQLFAEKLTNAETW